eukprot:8489759-Alexandrium_andersonii.AAC.1
MRLTSRPLLRLVTPRQHSALSSRPTCRSTACAISTTAPAPRVTCSGDSTRCWRARAGRGGPGAQRHHQAVVGVG